MKTLQKIWDSLQTEWVERTVQSASQALIPCFHNTFEWLVRNEIEVNPSFITNRLNQAQEWLEQLDKSKSDFFAIAAHQLKTLLTLVEGYTAVLRKELWQQVDVSRNLFTLIEGIGNGAKCLHSIIEDMIDVSLRDNSPPSLNVQPTWVSHWFVNLAHDLRPATEGIHQTLHIPEFPGSDEAIIDDPEQLLPTFRNILDYAIKINPGGTFWVKSEGYDERRSPGSTFHFLNPKHPPLLEGHTADLMAIITQTPSLSE